MKSLSLTIKAGASALASLKADGLDMAAIGTIAGASGGAKWLVLSQLDRAIIESVVPHLEGPVHLLGTSIGSWRFACYAQSDPLAAIRRFEHAYVEQSYSKNPDIREITEKSREIIRHVLGPDGAHQIINHPVFRTHVMAVRAKHLMQYEHRWVLGPALLTAALLNVLSRKSLGLFFERALFYDTRDLPPFFDVRGFPLQRIPLTVENVADAIVATGSIPMVLTGVRDIAGAQPGVYRDGGVIDYHHDLPHSAKERYTLYPHFYDRLVPGWFDKKLGWRRPQAANVDRTILISPSPEFVSRLPYGKIPDRTDFVSLTPSQRIEAWKGCIDACQELADDFREVIAKDRLAAYVQPL